MKMELLRLNIMNNSLKNIDIEIFDSSAKITDNQNLACNNCGHIFYSCPQNHLNFFIKHGNNGCPKCQKL